jgi:hypothetical protein
VLARVRLGRARASREPVWEWGMDRLSDALHDLIHRWRGKAERAGESGRLAASVVLRMCATELEVELHRLQEQARRAA